MQMCLGICVSACVIVLRSKWSQYTKIKPQSPPVFSVCSATTGIKKRTHLLGR